MAANGIPAELFITIFKQTVDCIKGLAKRVSDGTYNDGDIRLMSVCSEVCNTNISPLYPSSLIPVPLGLGHQGGLQQEPAHLGHG